MRRKIKTKILTVRMDRERIGLFNALIDGAGRLGICRTRNNEGGVVDIIASADTFNDLRNVVKSIAEYMGDVEITGEMEWDGEEDFWR